MDAAFESVSSNTASELDLSRPEDVLTYLADTPFASTRAEQLSGGSANFIFRLYLATPFAAAGHAGTLIFSNAKSWVPGNKDFAYDIQRQNFEAIALKLLHAHALLPTDALLTVPSLFHHDTEAHVLIIEDAGPGVRNLDHLLRESPLSETASRDLGTALGRFLAAVHVQGSANPVLLEGVQKNEDSRRLTAWVTYGRLIETLKRLGQNTGLIEPPLNGDEGPSETQIAEISVLADETIQKIYEADSEFTMGDFWSGNVVVRLTESGSIDRLFIIDWEMAKPGLRFIDFAQFTAQMNTLRRFHPEADASVTVALGAFEEAYRQGAQVDEQFIRSAASHVGAHMISVTPNLKNWGSKKERTREVVKEGIEYLLGGLHGDMEWLRTSVVGGLLSRTSA